MKSGKLINIISIIVAVIIVGGAVLFTKNSDFSNDNKNEEQINNVNIVDGKQIIEIRAKGGYYPRKIIAKAEIPTILKFNTDATYDCSTYLVIPSINLREVLPSSGSKEIDIGAQEASTFKGTCSMGMYSFVIDFQE